jgi:hypothetical protein
VRALVRRVGSSAFVRHDLRAAVVPWLVARVLVVAALAVARFAWDEIGGPPKPIQLDQGLFAWDAAFYRDVAEQGYAALARPSLRFFPLYPVVGRWLGTVFFDHTAAALLVISNGAALAFSALLHRLALRETGDAGVARRAAWYGAVLPPAMTLVAGYAEGLALALAVGVFLAMRTRHWLWAALLGLLAGLCRPVGLLLVVPLAIEAVASWDAAAVRERLARVGAVVSPAVGMGAYLAWVGVEFGDPLYPLTVQNRRGLRGGFVDPFTRVVDGVGDLFGGDRFGSGLHVLWAVACVALVVVLVRRLPASYWAYATTALVLALTARNLDSFERYALSTFPFVLAVALVTTRPDADRVVNAAAAAGLVGYSVLAFLGLYVP